MLHPGEYVVKDAEAATEMNISFESNIPKNGNRRD